MRARIRARHVGIAVVVILLGYEIVAATLDTLTPGPGGTTSSSYATTHDGLAALAELLARTGHPVAQLRSRPATSRLPAASTVFVIDPASVTAGDIAALRRYAASGGRVVAGGTGPSGWLEALASPRTPGLVVIGDTSRLQNQHLADDANAAFSVSLAGGAGRAVIFAESVHGYGVARGLAALPTRWKWALVGLALAAAAWVASRFRRLGPPQPDEPAPLPARRGHVDAVAAALQRTQQPQAAVAPVRARARELVVRRMGLSPDATPETVRQAAVRAGLDDPAARAVAGLDAPRDDADVLVYGRALAELSGVPR